MRGHSGNDIPIHIVQILCIKYINGDVLTSFEILIQNECNIHTFASFRYLAFFYITKPLFHSFAIGGDVSHVAIISVAIISVSIRIVAIRIIGSCDVRHVASYLYAAKLQTFSDTAKQTDTKIPRKSQHLTGEFCFYYITLLHSRPSPLGELVGGTPSPWGRAGERLLHHCTGSVVLTANDDLAVLEYLYRSLLSVSCLGILDAYEWIGSTSLNLLNL